jgi:hypothetical protein
VSAVASEFQCFRSVSRKTVVVGKSQRFSLWGKCSARPNGATGMSDMAGKAARVAVEPSGSERDTMELTGSAT